jgi:serine/threonine protein kinase
MKDVLGNFELVEQIDPGGFTTVYRAVEQMGQGITRPAAVKILHDLPLDDQEKLEAVRREVDVLVDLGGSPNVVTIYGLGVDEDVGSWIAMELGGKSLKHFITDDPADPDQVRVLLRDTLRALSVVHGTRPPVLHRDLKPSNILSSDFGIWKIADFGLARRGEADDTLELATVQYAAPEMLDATLGAESPKMDLYSLGMIAYEYALGRTLYRKQFPSVYDPYAGKTDSNGDERPKWMYWHTSRQMTVPPIAEIIEDYPQDLSDLIAALTAKPMDERPASADQALDRLGDVHARLALSAEEISPDELEEPQRKFPTLLLAITALVILIGLIGVMLVGIDRAPEVQLAEELFTGNKPKILVTGTIERFPRGGTAIVTMPGGLPYDVDVHPDGRFTSEVRVPEVGRAPGEMVVRDRSGRLLETEPVFLERFPPESVEFVLRTRPLVSGARVTITERETPGQPILLRTDDRGSARASVAHGMFDLEVTHPRYKRRFGTLDTGDDPSPEPYDVDLNEISLEQLYRDMKRKIERLTTLARRKADCELTEKEGEELERTLEDLQQLGEGDPDIEDFIAAVKNVEECNPASFAGVEAAAAKATATVSEKEEELRRLKEAQQGSLARARPGLSGADDGRAGSQETEVPVGDVGRTMQELITLIKQLAKKKADCKATVLDEEELRQSVEKLRRLGQGEPDIEAFIVAVEKVKACDPDSYAGVEEAAQRAMQRAQEIAEQEKQERLRRARELASRIGASPDEIRDIIEAIAAGDDPTDLINRISQRTLMALPLDVFRDFIEINVPSGVLTVEIVPHLNKVRISGPVFDGAKLDRLHQRLAAALPRLQLELRPDAWAVCRRLKDRLEQIGADVRTHAYLARGDHVLYVQVNRSERIDEAAAMTVAKDFVIDRDLLHVLGYPTP